MTLIDVPINDLTPNGRAFNCSIVEEHGKLRLFYRFERLKNYNTEIGVVNLDDQFHPIESTNKHLKMVRFNPRVTTFDDPRAFMMGDKLYFMYSNGFLANVKGNQQWCAGVALAEVKGTTVVKQWVPRYGANENQCMSASHLISTEKNWSPFVSNGMLHLVYTINPLVILQWDIKKNVCTKITESSFDQKFWKHGEFLGGGTPLMKNGDEYIGFFHSFTDDKSGTPGCRQYHVGFYAIKQGQHSWRVTRLSKKPIMSAKRDDKRDLRGKSSSWRPNCIYPCGFITRGDNVIVSQGWQDCRSELAVISWKDVLKDVIDVK